MHGRYIRSILSREGLLPKYVGHEISSSKHLIHNDLEIVRLIVVNRHPNRPILCQQVPQQFQARPHHRQPLAMFEIVVVMLKRRARVVRRVNVDTLHLAGIERQQCLQRLQIVALNQHVTHIRFPRGKVRRFFQQAIGHAGSGADVGVAGEPVQGGHGLWSASGVFLSGPSRNSLLGEVLSRTTVFERAISNHSSNACCEPVSQFPGFPPDNMIVLARVKMDFF